MRTLELFSGSRSFSKVMDKLRYSIFTVDNQNFDKTDLVVDILELDVKDLPKVDVIWASPPCTGFSVASIGTHWTGGKNAYIPKTPTAQLGIDLVNKTIEIIDKLQPKYWYIENPRGVLRKLELIGGIRHTITYCQYGEERMKPTDIWTNDPNWTPRPMCKNGMPCHIAAPRGSKTGTQGRAGAYERSMIPDQLFYEIAEGWA